VSFSSKVANFNPPNLHLSPPQEVIPFEFRHDLWRQKTRVMAIIQRYLRDPTFSHFDTIPECDRHTHRQTDGHMTTAYTALSIASRGKN